MLCIFAPIMLVVIAVAPVDNRASNLAGGILFILIIVVYITFVIDYFLPGIRIFHDLLTNSFVTSEVSHVNSFVVKRYDIFEKGYFTSRKMGVKEEIFMTVICSENNGKGLILSASRYHGMQRDERYTIVYGKRSKIIVSIISANNQELFDVPYEQYISIAQKPKKNSKWK